MKKWLDFEGFWLTLWYGLGMFTVLLLPNSPLSFAFCITSILLTAYSVGKRLLPSAHGFTAIVLTSTTIVALQTILQTIAFYASIPLNNLVLFSSTIISCAIHAYYSTFFDDLDTTIDSVHWSRNEYGVSLLVTGCISMVTAILFRYLISSQSHQSIRSPWEVVSVLIPFTLAALLTLPITLKTFIKRQRFFSYALVGFLACFTLLTVIIYPEGYGFDGFLHRASESLLITDKTLQPKPFYYIGQYSFVSWVHAITDLPLSWIDRLLVPAASMLLIASWLIHREKRKVIDLTYYLLCIPLGWLITSTPQSFAYLLGIVSLNVFSRDHEERLTLFVPWLMALWALITHPLAGIPFCFVLFGLTMMKYFPSWKSPIGIGATALFAGAAVPAAFFLLSLIGAQTITWDIQKLFSIDVLKTMLQLLAPRANAALWPDWVELVKSTSSLFLILLGFFGLRISKDSAQSYLQKIFFWSALSIGASGWILRSISEFTFLIQYERGFYADRLLLISALLMAYPASIALKYFVDTRKTLFAITSVFLAIFFWGSAHIYMAFPRADAAEMSRGWSVSAADREAVQWIQQQQSTSTAFTVLANQNMSAVAVELYGFKRYVKTQKSELFYYPIPTGEKLYEHFLSIAQKPTKDEISEVGTLMQSDTVYIAIHSYWWDSKRVIADLEALEPRKIYTTNDGAITIFQFTTPLRPR